MSTELWQVWLPRLRRYVHMANKGEALDFAEKFGGRVGVIRGERGPELDVIPAGRVHRKDERGPVTPESRAERAVLPTQGDQGQP